MVAGGIAGNAIVPGIGYIPGAYLGGNGGKYIAGLISPDITNLSIKDIGIESLSDFINNAGNFLGSAIYSPLPQPSN